MDKESGSQAAFERGAGILMACVSVISLLAVTGWLINRPILASFRPEYIPMAPATALIFLGICGIWLIQRVFPSRPGMRILAQAGLLGMLIIVLVLGLRYFSGFGPDLEHLLYPNPSLFGQVSSARVSPLSALGFFLAIPAFLLMTGRQPGKQIRTAAASLSIAVSILSGIYVVGYLYGVPPLYGGTVIPVALTTAIAFLFLSLGLLMTAGPSSWPVRVFVGPSIRARFMRVFIPASLFIVLVQGFLSSVALPWLNPALGVAVAALAACLIVLIIISFITNSIGADIERGRQAEETLQESEERFRTLFEQAAVGVALLDTRTGRFVSINQKYCDFLGYTAEEMLRKSLQDVTHPDDTQANLDGNASLMAGTLKEFSVEKRYVRSDGAVVWGNLTASPLWQAGTQPDNYVHVAVVQDITGRKRAEEALRQSEAELRALFASMHDVVLVIDRAGVYRKIAPTNPGLLVKPPEELLGRNLREVFTPEKAVTFIGTMQQVLDTRQTAQIEYDLVIGDQTVWFETSISPMTEDSTLWVAHDITPRRRFELVQNAIFRITQSAIASEGVEALYGSIHSILGELIPTENFYIALYDAVGESISFPYFVDQYDEKPPGLTKLQGLTGYVIRTGRPLLATREALDRLVGQGEVEAVGTVGVDWMGAPLKVEGRTIGVMAVQSYAEGIHFSHKDLNLLEFVSTQVAQAIERKRMEEEIRDLALTDQLTGLYNRRGFTLLAEQEVKVANRLKKCMLLIFCDVDDLKVINDRHGHAQGDLALREVSAILKETFREVDIPARIGGDEFVVLAVDASIESAESLTDRIRAELDRRNQQGDRPYQLTFSMGIAPYDPAAPCTVNELMAQADGLMYQQKLGKNRKN